MKKPTFICEAKNHLKFRRERTRTYDSFFRTREISLRERMGLAAGRCEKE